jgi:hypothetical protein
VVVVVGAGDEVVVVDPEAADDAVSSAGMVHPPLTVIGPCVPGSGWRTTFQATVGCGTCVVTYVVRVYVVVVEPSVRAACVPVGPPSAPCSSTEPFPTMPSAAPSTVPAGGE